MSALECNVKWPKNGKKCIEFIKYTNQNIAFKNIFTNNILLKSGVLIL